MNNVNFASFADDNTPNVIGDGLMHVIESLTEASGKIFCRFSKNQMKANPKRFHLVISSSDEVSMKVVCET